MKEQKFEIHQLRPLIAWPYLEYAWGVAKADDDAKASLRKDAEAMLDEWEGTFSTSLLTATFEAYSEGDDIIIAGKCFPMLRQQSGEFLSLADYIKPHSLGTDSIGVFATTMDSSIPALTSDDPYERMLAQTLADRLAEATAEKMSEKMPGIRPAVGYPVMPDMSLNFLVDELIDMKQIGIRLTESGMMMPHASISGLVINHPKAKYFNIGKIGADQLADYASRRGYTLEQMQRYIKIK